jgi:AraC-like DNA-binding protein
MRSACWKRGICPVDEISAAVSCEDPSFFRRLFKRYTGLTPSPYRRMFQPVASAVPASDDSQSTLTGASDRLVFNQILIIL